MPIELTLANRIWKLIDRQGLCLNLKHDKLATLPSMPIKENFALCVVL